MRARRRSSHASGRPTHVVPTATATTLRRPNADGKYAPLVTDANGDFGVHLDPAPGVLGAEVHYTTDGSTPTLASTTFVSGDPSLQIRQDTTGALDRRRQRQRRRPARAQKVFDIVESTNAAPEITKVAATPVSGTVDVTLAAARPTRRSTGYRVQAYTGTSADVATGVRVGDPGERRPADRRRGHRGRPPRRRPHQRHELQVLGRGPLRHGLQQRVRAERQRSPRRRGRRRARARTRRSCAAGPSRSTAPRRRRSASYKWAPAPPGGRGQRPTATRSLTLTGATTAKPTFRFPTKSSPTSDDGTYQFRLTTTTPSRRHDVHPRPTGRRHASSATPSAATASRWRAGDDLVGTGSQENARLTLPQRLARPARWSRTRS